MGKRTLYNREFRRKNHARIREREFAWHNSRPLYLLVKNAKVRAKKKGLPFDLDDRKIEKPTHCPVFGIQLNYTHGTGKRCGPDSPSLDRTDPSKGYVHSNVRVISHRANTIKSDASLEELEKVVEYVRKQSTGCGQT